MNGTERRSGPAHSSHLRPGSLGVLAVLAALGAAQAPDGDTPAYATHFEAPAGLADFVFSDPDAWHWSAHGALALAAPSRYEPPHRSPLSIALVDGQLFGDFALEAELRQTGREYGHRDLCLVFGFENAERYYYAHLATSPDERAHNIFLVDGAPRRNLAPVAERGIDWGAPDEEGGWHRVRLERSLSAGTIRVLFDGQEVLHAVDRTLAWGRVGWGSFDDTGEMRSLRVWADEVRPAPSPTPFRPKARVQTAHLAAAQSEGFSPLRRAFAAANPGYDVEWHAGLLELPAEEAQRVLFVQSGEASATVQRANGSGAESSDPPLVRGDVVLLRPGDSLHCVAPLGVLAFRLPDPLPESVPAFVRPDWDPRITDTPGGCAEDTDAYRRILLTWLAENGPYVYRGLNCHRVRITDSFTHYHPLDGGFDEFYLVQGVQEGARLLTSENLRAIEEGTPTSAEAAQLLQRHALAVGDLVYLPRGTVHRGLGGVLAQVITTPGFRPGAEIGVDHHLQRINAALALEGDAALPLHKDNARKAITK